MRAARSRRLFVTTLTELNAIAALARMGLSRMPNAGYSTPAGTGPPHIAIAPDGSVEIHVKGYKGKSCLEAMKIFEQVVGEMKSQRETSEFYEPDEQVRFNIEQRH